MATVDGKFWVNDLDRRRRPLCHHAPRMTITVAEREPPRGRHTYSACGRQVA